MDFTDDYIRVSVNVTGRVQGVGFRYWTLKLARRMGVHGHVCNNSDGSVDAVFCGRAGVVEEIVLKCSQGPAHGKVENLFVLSREPVERCSEGFEILL